MILSRYAIDPSVPTHLLFSMWGALQRQGSLILALPSPQNLFQVSADECSHLKGLTGIVIWSSFGSPRLILIPSRCGPFRCWHTAFLDLPTLVCSRSPACTTSSCSDNIAKSWLIYPILEHDVHQSSRCRLRLLRGVRRVTSYLRISQA